MRGLWKDSQLQYASMSQVAKHPRSQRLLVQLWVARLSPPTSRLLGLLWGQPLLLFYQQSLQQRLDRVLLLHLIWKLPRHRHQHVLETTLVVLLTLSAGREKATVTLTTIASATFFAFLKAVTEPTSQALILRTTVVCLYVLSLPRVFQ